MKVSTCGNKITIYVCNYDYVDINEYIKGIISKLRKNYKIDIVGFYQINVYCNALIGMIIEMIKDEDFDSFYDFLDIKISVYQDCDIYLKFDDYFFGYKRKVFVLNNEYYLDTKDLSKKELFELLEFCSFVYGNNLDYIKEKLVCIA